MAESKTKILCIGEEWRGSNASGLFYALSRVGCITTVVNELAYVSVKGAGFSTKAMNWSIRKTQIQDFNNQLTKITKSVKPDWVFVYKGAFIKPETIYFWKKHGLPVVNFFPDVSFRAHGRYIPDCIRLYDHIFTTKSFGAQDLEKNFGIHSEKVSFLPHGFDPAVHRPLPTDPAFHCDVSFIGNYSLHKESYLKTLKQHMPEMDLKIWGSTWRKNGPLSNAIQSIAVLGDSYALAIGSSKVNVALLSEVVKGASSGDQVTSRSFHIPAAGGFMLHQRTEEIKQYFEEDKEIACFESEDELADKVTYYLNKESERERMRVNGHKRAIIEHSLDARAKSFVQILRAKKII